MNSIRDVTIGDKGEMTGVLSRLHEFHATLEPWEQYMERLGHFLDTNGITNIDKKQSVPLISNSTSTVLAPDEKRVTKS